MLDGLAALTQSATPNASRYEAAIAQLRLRRDRLADANGAIWLRHSQINIPARTFRLWSRGVAWYLLGFARTLDVLDDPPQDLIDEFRRAAEVVISLQREDGMWCVFCSEPTTAPESSGTAGIATAFAIGVRRGWLGEKAAISARHAFVGLSTFLTPDGFLAGVAPGNKNGEEIQRATKGYILQFGIGLYAQLVAELS